MSHPAELTGSVNYRVAAWRQARLLTAGFDAQVAFDFAHHDAVDLHELLDLVDGGCPPGLAARIRAPLDDRGAHS